MNHLADYSLTQLLPSEPSRRLPPISFRTLNGYQFWPLPLPDGGEETEAPRVRRAFAVRAPAGETRRCIVEITPPVRELIRTETRQDFRPTDGLWDTVCKGVLSDTLWTRAMMPPEVLTVSTLPNEHLEVVRTLARRGTRACC
jgi:hypothetical protein